MKNFFDFKAVLILGALGASGLVRADITVPMTLVDAQGTGKSIGHITISETGYGALFTPSLSDLPPGLHGFHVHRNPSCEPAMKDGVMTAAAAAGDHHNGGKEHGAPWGEGHRGDLPALYIASDGTATHPVLAPRLKLNELDGKSLMIHAGGDNYSDRPQPAGGGGARIACGIIE